MATATGNIVFDFKAMSDVDPFTSSEFTYLTDGRDRLRRLSGIVLLLRQRRCARRLALVRKRLCV